MPAPVASDDLVVLDDGSGRAWLGPRSRLSRGRGSFRVCACPHDVCQDTVPALVIFCEPGVC